MLYKTTCAILYRGSRVERGTELEMSQEDAARLAGNVVPVTDSNISTEPTPEPEAKELEDMSKAELEEAAAERGLATSGTKAELIERIQLHDEAPEDDAGE